MSDASLKKAIGTYLKRQREKSNFSQSKVAKDVGVSAQFYGLIEKGKVGCPRDILVKAIPILGLRPAPIRRIYLQVAEKQVRDMWSKIEFKNSIS